MLSAGEKVDAGYTPQLIKGYYAKRPPESVCVHTDRTNICCEDHAKFIIVHGQKCRL